MSLALQFRDGLKALCKQEQNQIHVIYKDDIFTIRSPEAEWIYLILDDKSSKSKYFPSFTDFYNFCFRDTELFPMSTINRDIYLLDSSRSLRMDKKELDMLTALQSNFTLIESRVYFRDLFLEESLTGDPPIEALKHGLTIYDLGSQFSDRMKEKIAAHCNQNMEWFTELYSLPHIYSEVDPEDVKIVDVYHDSRLELDDEGLIPQYFGWVEYMIPYSLADAILIAHGVDNMDEVDSAFQIEDPEVKRAMMSFIAGLCRRF